MARLLAAVSVAVIVVGIAGPAMAQAVVPARDLIENPANLDGDVVTVEGELIGDYGFRSDGTMWTQLNDDSYARRPLVDGGPRTGANVGIGIRMPARLAEDLDPPGGYRVRGPLVQATGVWRYHDPARGGESYLEVTELVVVESGRALDEGARPVPLIAGALLVLVAAWTFLSYRKVRDRL